MKKYSLLFSAFAGIALIFSACNKEPKPCTNYTGHSNTGHLVDLSSVAAKAPQLMDSLNKYPQLQAYKIMNYDDYLRVDCYVYHKNIRMFSQSYGLVTRIGSSEVSKVGNNQTEFAPAISLTPSVTWNQAIETALVSMDFGNSCLTYTLSIIDMAQMNGLPGNDDKLVWIIASEDIVDRYVAVDAQTNEVLTKNTGIWD